MLKSYNQMSKILTVF